MDQNEQDSTDGRPLVGDARRLAIAEVLRSAGSVSVAEIEERFGVSSMTARRDLAELERRGMARRTHGGAVVPSITAHEDSFASRVEREPEAKLALAAAAADMVGEGESLFLDGSTTALFVARALVERGTRMTILTNSLPIMELVGARSTAGVDLVGVGGSLRRLTRSFVGPIATRTVEAHVADRVFFSVKGVSRDGLITDADALEAEVKRAMISRASESTLLLDATKLETRGLNVIAKLADITAVLAHGLADADVRVMTLAGPTVVSVAGEAA